MNKTGIGTELGGGNATNTDDPTFNSGTFSVRAISDFGSRQVFTIWFLGSLRCSICSHVGRFSTMFTTFQSLALCDYAAGYGGYVWTWWWDWKQVSGASYILEGDGRLLGWWSFEAMPDDGELQHPYLNSWIAWSKMKNKGGWLRIT